MSIPDERICTKCRTVKPLDQFSKAPRGRYGVKSSCKACDAARHRELFPPKPRVRKPLKPAKLGTETKTCRRCGETKHLDEFGLSRRATETTNDVYRSDCLRCNSDRTMEWHRRNPGRSIANKRKAGLKAYGLTPQGYADMLRVQGGVCAICSKGMGGREVRLCVDHDHATGRARGLLCDKCNRAIGLLGDDPVLLRKAITYLLRPPGHGNSSKE